MNKAKKIKTAVGVANRTDPYFALGTARVESDRFWRWGDDNLFPAALAHSFLRYQVRFQA